MAFHPHAPPCPLGGPEAVYIFFILSGIVLTLPVLRATKFRWISYYPKRLVRLYVPVIAAVLIAMTIFAIVPQHGFPGISEWAASQTAALTVTGFMKDATLIFGISSVLGVLWSLRWEVWFSLLLPVFVLAAVQWRSGFWVKLAAIMAVITAGAFAGNPAIFYMPMFAIGVLIASELERIKATTSRIAQSKHGSASMIGIGGVAVLAFCSYWLILPITTNKLLEPTSRPVVVIGAAMIVVISAFWKPAHRI
ncbi:acyltransferase family protein [Arthrobacter sp. 2MCAF14]|uniref:acyltransferase family protein n=1 Tax=Arthrobacter sp. 2MCAF14 TaxID=3232982 RepID=UPI003F91CEB8